MTHRHLRDGTTVAELESCIRLALSFERGEDDPEPSRPEGANKAAISDFVFSTQFEGRDGDVIDQATWRLDEWRANPVILDSHYGDVIGRGLTADVVEITKRGKTIRELRGSIEWDMDSPRGAIVGGQHLRGFRKAVSVRWSPGKTTARNELPPDHFAFQKPRKVSTPWGDVEVVGRFMEQCTLLEVSSVGVPGDPRALQLRGAPVSDGSPVAPPTPSVAELLAAPEFAPAVRAHVLDLLRSDADIARALRAFVLAEPSQPLADYGELLAQRILTR